MLNLKEKKEVSKRLHYLQGQLSGVERMIEEDRPIGEIFNQLKAVEQGVHSTIYNVLENQVKMHLAEVLSERLAACPGNCSDAERLRFLKTEFAKLNLKELINELAWLRNSLNAFKPVTTSMAKEVRT